MENKVVEEEEQTPWLALTMFLRTLEFNEDELKQVVDQLRHGNTFVVKKVGKPNGYASFKVRAKRRLLEKEKLREYWFTNDVRRQFLKDYESGSFKKK